MSIIMRANNTTVVCSETKYMSPKATMISMGMGISASSSIRALRSAMARMMKGNQMVLISWTGISSIKVSFMAWSRKTRPVAAISVPFGPWNALISSMSFLIFSQNSSALAFMFGGTRQIHCSRIACLSADCIGFSPSWWCPEKPKYEWIWTMDPGLVKLNRLISASISVNHPLLRAVSAVAHWVLHFSTIISRRRIARLE
mmetsp:Transcript_88270/g.230296  ORF Transcript_88270/g.230296 Transcript_88270/m.230296 type:complete len:201 (-) Transcript_88270:303-905(-)